MLVGMVGPVITLGFLSSVDILLPGTGLLGLYDSKEHPRN